MGRFTPDTACNERGWCIAAGRQSVGAFSSTAVGKGRSRSHQGGFARRLVAVVGCVMRLRVGTDFLAGLLLAGIGGIGVWLGSGYALGTSVRMGPGFFPLLVSGALVAFGLVTSLKALAVDEPIDRDWPLRPLVLVLAGVAAFALTIRPLGLVVATILLVIVSALGGRGSRPVETVLLALAVAAFGALVFIRGLGIGARIWPW